MSTSDVVQAILGGAPLDEFARICVPDRYRAAVLHRREVTMFAGVPDAECDCRRSLHVEEVETPPIAPDEALVAVMASAINYNTVWSALFRPVPTFRFLAELGRRGQWGARHDQGYHVIGSDAAGVVLRTGSLVGNWRPGDAVVVHPLYSERQDPEGHDDGVLGSDARAWGYETNFGGLAELALVKATQLMPKPAHLSWEEAAVNGLCNATSYRMLLGGHGALMRPGDVVLIWGATGGLGAFAFQHVRRGGGIPVCVTSSPERAGLLRRLGCDAVIDRAEAGYRFWKDPHTQNPAEWHRFRNDVRRLAGADPRIVFEHPGRATMGASVYVTQPGGTIVTCAATTGYMIEYDNRHLWMKLKTIRSSHGANYAEATRANELVCRGEIIPPLSATYPLSRVGEAADLVRGNRHVGKVGVLCLAPEEGLGITAERTRQSISAERLSAFRDFAAARP
jgi:crotonyl-CoA reductase